MEGAYGAIYPSAQSALPRVPIAAPSSPSLPWSRVGEIAIFVFVAVLSFYLLWVWVLRDLIFVVKARRGHSTEELRFGPTVQAPPVAPVSVPGASAVTASCPPEPRPFCV
ncbi:movement protein [Saccharum streak virus]|uniref:Movement protein n=1 Tax=Saccharum streak virus TaxID=683179 RepID=D0U2D6_9GEMI|nr:movement protein [Saccharum streak virus]ACY08851.1 movement protein [Saccharum streak virus]